MPVVHRAKSGSPLEGALLHKDRILGIDEVDYTMAFLMLITVEQTFSNVKMLHQK